MMLAFLALRHFYGDELSTVASESASATQTIGGGEKTVWSEPKIEITSVQEVDPPRAVQAPVSSGRQSLVGVYECTVNGQRVASDQPCGPGAQLRTLTVDHPDPSEVTAQQQRTWLAQQTTDDTSNSRANGSQAVDPAAANQSACAAVERQIAALNARMRQGYTSQEGEWLRAQWQALQKRRAELKCGR
jgi:hypothetical protein